MSLNNIDLPPRLLADLYPDLLTEKQGGAPPSPPPIPPFLGDNQSGIMVLVNYPAVTFIPDDQLAFLTTVLSACGRGLSDIALVNLAKVDKNHLHMINSRHVILFGSEPPDIGLPLNFPAFRVQDFDRRRYIHCPSLQEIELNIPLKKELWAALKKLFLLE